MRGLTLGGVAVVIFAPTLPMARLAVGDAAAPPLPPAFVALLTAWALLGETLQPATPWCTLAVAGVVFVGRRMRGRHPSSKRSPRCPGPWPAAPSGSSRR